MNLIEKFLGNFIPDNYVIIVSVIIFFGIILSILSLYNLFIVWLERKVAGHMQVRPGPMVTGGFHGWLQTVADGIKLFLKEDIIPKEADNIFFWISPALIMAVSFAVWVCIPLGIDLIPADLNLGIFFIIAISSPVVVGIVMAGWASKNKWAMLGAFRSAAQIVSYEIPVALSILPPIIYAGTLSMTGIVDLQIGGFWNWLVFRNPFLFLTFITYYISAVAEVNRSPFDLPEAESELVAGFHTEYSGMRFAMFFFAEYSNMLAVSAIAVTLFLGGWSGPLPTSFVLRIPVSVLNFFAKTMFLVYLMIWFRWTFPRLRVDQLMNLCWKFFIPLSFINLFGTTLWKLLL
ncbi:MAG: NADH-quinone oxidoreductase subunit NuoH [Candidatus Hydrogenedentota bacterium]